MGQKVGTALAAQVSDDYGGDWINPARGASFGGLVGSARGAASYMTASALAGSAS